MTKAEEFIKHIQGLKTYWLGMNKNTEDTLDGFIHSLLAMLDGDSSVNDFTYITLTDSSDNEIINPEDCWLHKLLFDKGA